MDPFAHLEPNLEIAMTWWSELPAKWTPFGWQDHIFRFNVLYNGLLIAIPNLNPRTKKYEGEGVFVGLYPWDRVDFPGHVKDPQDQGMIVQGWTDDAAPVLWSEWAHDGILLRSTVFGHIPGGQATERGDEPLFAWMRLSVHDLLEGLPLPETYRWNLCINAPYMYTGAMSIRYNIAVDKTKSRYPRELTPEPAAYDPKTGQCLVEPDGRVRLGILPGHEGAVDVLPHKPGEDDFLISLELPVEKGAHVDLLVPMLPTAPEVFDAEFGVGYDAALAEANAFWDRKPASAATFDVPEDQINATLRNNLRLSRVIAELEPETKTYGLMTGSWVYSDVWATPAAMQCALSLDALGHHEAAAKYLRPYIDHQGEVLPKGDHFKPHPGSLGPPKLIAACVWTSDHGAVLWAIAHHALVTEDPEYIALATEPIVKACEFVREMRHIDSHDGHKGLLPPGMATDMPTQIQSVWADGWNYKGLITAVRFLQRIGHPRAEEFAAEAEDYRTTFRKALVEESKKMPTWTDGDGNTHHIVPLATWGAQPFEFRNAFYFDTGPLMLVFAELLEAGDPLMTSTLKWFREGPPTQHYRYDGDCWQVPSLYKEMGSCEPCFSFNVFHNHRLKDRQHYLEGMYSLFVGAISRQTQTACETRGGVTGVIGAHLPTWLARLAVVDDQIAEDELHLLRVVPLAWLPKHRESIFDNMPTNFGPVSLRARLSENGEELHVSYKPNFRRDPARVLLHIPPAPGLQRVMVNGKERKWDGRAEMLEL